ncbi:peptidoglycan recognition family protein [Streptomyces sp. DSM 44938]|uniref:N-acetylmuramoyl-L-alanine amidase n=1 Tax=Streptomyces litchfieldiae TaxID=3075543 RepID=A0ABU2MTM3_9ACTN|nr:peptidoglycan recognition family protein [Streptomyces sp. DSM 44938]MDT0344991.1 peptidoglycan recognition family protein [Streptomyces sp. DSM 44938]
MRESSPQRPRRARRAAVATAAAAVALPLLSGSPPAGADSDATALQEAFADAAEEYDVPESVLLGVSYLQSRWDGHRGAASVSGGYGPMHLTDAETALAEAGEHHGHGGEDPRGDESRPLDPAEPEPASASALPAALRTLPEAAELTGLPAGELRTSEAANVRGGAALLAAAQRELGLPASDDPADWYGAVAAYAGAETREAAEVFADEVYAVINEGTSRVTAEGRRVVLEPLAVTPVTAAADGLGLPAAPRDPEVECPRSVSCEWIPAPYEELGDGDYGNHDLADRPASQAIDYIVIHDTEATWQTTLDLVTDPTYVSWHYSLRSSDGHIAQHLSNEDVGWHAGNWYVNANSIGLEHEGFLTSPDAWYTEAMYRTSARLVRYLSRQYDIPLDRHHIIGHDNVQGPVNASVAGMHTDPGPYWDWSHYFELLGAPFRPTAGPGGGIVTIAPDYDSHAPVFTDCGGSGNPCAPHGSAAVRLHTAPDANAPLVSDIATHPGDGRSSTGVNDVGARATAGQQFAVAGREGDWTAIWYLGQQAWFHNPADAPTAVNARGWVVTGKDGAATIPVYGRAYPEAAAYPADVPAQPVVPLAYQIPADQEYVVGQRTESEYYRAVTFDPANHQVVRGEVYYQIQLGHRIAYVRAADVEVRRSGS